MRKRVLAGLLGAAVVGTSLFPPLGTVPSALANTPIFLCIDPEIEPPSPNIFNSAKDARAFAKDNAGVVCSALHDHQAACVALAARGMNLDQWVCRALNVSAAASCRTPLEHLSEQFAKRACVGVARSRAESDGFAREPPRHDVRTDPTRGLLAVPRRTAADSPVLPLAPSGNEVLAHWHTTPLTPSVPKPHGSRARIPD